MILEHPIPPFLEWIGPAAANWGLAVLALSALFLIVCFVLLLVFKGAKQAGPVFAAGVADAWKDIKYFSWKRCFAIASLAIRESLRKKVVAVCVVFLALLMFAGWFLDPGSKDPARLCASFVYQATTYLVLLLALFLSALSLPADFKNKTIFTIVTKPVRSSEIVLGRVIGIGTIGTCILLLMAVCSYFFVANTLKHTHVLNDAEDLVYVQNENASNDPTAVIAKGYTRLANGHKHEVEKYADGSLRVIDENGHSHAIEQTAEGGVVRYKIGDAQGSMQAKSPIYGKIKFRNSESFERERGINVGEEWDYRSYIAGATDEAVIWTFDNISAQKFADGLPVEMTISVFRTHMGNIEKTIMGALYVRNPETGLIAETHVFNSEKYTTKALNIPRKIDRAKVKNKPWLVKKMGEKESFEAAPDSALPQKEEYDLFEDFVVNGKLEIWLQCLDQQQYFGAAAPDLYIRNADANVFFNFIKGYLGVWQQMLIVVCFGVLFSAFLSGPVAMASTFGIMIAGFCKTLFIEIAHLQALGGGPIESFNRLITHENMMVDLPNTFSTHLGQAFDHVAAGLLSVIGLALPSFSDYNYYADCVANGYNIPWNSIAVHLVTTFSFVVPLFILAYIVLRNREVAKQ